MTPYDYKKWTKHISAYDGWTVWVHKWDWPYHGYDTAYYYENGEFKGKRTYR